MIPSVCRAAVGYQYHAVSLGKRCKLDARLQAWALLGENELAT
jgi:hypothetical protein